VRRERLPAIFWIDVFTARPFGGAPVPVVALDSAAPAAVPTYWLLRIAREMGQTDTAFLWPDASPPALRVVTPTGEVPPAVRGVLAAAVVLRVLGAKSDELTFVSGDESRVVQCDGDELVVTIPRRDLDPIASPPEPLLEILGDLWSEVLRSPDDWVAILGDERAVRDFAPHMRTIEALPGRGVAIAAAGDGEHDFVMRFFCPPWMPEDSVTASVSADIASYWSRRLGIDRLSALQASPREGAFRLIVANDTVAVAGRAVLVAQGRPHVDFAY
jgi:predicted PhzF superfamily epimerase YddE/YHI9